MAEVERVYKARVRQRLREPGTVHPGLFVDVEITEVGIFIRVEGYSDAIEAKGGIVVGLELYESKPRLLVWADIRNEEPTHTISLAKAAEHLRGTG